MKERCVTISMCPPPCLVDFRTLCEKAYFGHLLEIHRGNIKAVANAAGMRRITCYGKLCRLGLMGAGLKDHSRRPRDKVKSWDSPQLSRTAAELLRELLGEAVDV